MVINAAMTREQPPSEDGQNGLIWAAIDDSHTREWSSGGQCVMHLGATDTHWMTTSPNGHALALAAPQSHADKTSSFMIPPILSTFDRVVATTTKPDMVRATALARGRAGDRGRTDVV